MLFPIKVCYLPVGLGRIQVQCLIYVSLYEKKKMSNFDRLKWCILGF